MHGHEAVPPWAVDLANASSGVMVLLIASMLLFMTGLLPVPVGYERGKVKWIMWCGTGMHAHTVYLTESGFQTLHPADRSGGEVGR